MPIITRKEATPHDLRIHNELHGFFDIGLGLVAPQSCGIIETLNGEYEPPSVHPIHGILQ